jgi:hypothetical protein
MEANSALNEWLVAIGLEPAIVQNTIELLSKEEIFEVSDVKNLTENDLKDLGIKLGTRKKILDGGIGKIITFLFEFFESIGNFRMKSPKNKHLATVTHC